MSEEDEISSKRAKGPLDVSRRALLIGAGSTAALLGLGALRYAGHNPLVRPPGGQDEARLVSACIRCEKCYEACPRGIIVPAHIEDGLLGMRSPALKFDADFCDYCADENGGGAVGGEPSPFVLEPQAEGNQAGGYAGSSEL